eukprot:scaffold84866_cov45-Phaeocystis_antarctica.AAC.1
MRGASPSSTPPRDCGRVGARTTERRRRRQRPTRAPYLRLRRKRGRLEALTPRTKKSGPVCLSSPNRATESPESCKPRLGAENRTGFEARRRRQARSATPSRPSAERGGLDGVRRRLPETSAPM